MFDAALFAFQIMKFATVALTAALLTISSSAWATHPIPPAKRRLANLTPLQKQQLVQAYRIGGLRLAALILVESSACQDLHGIDPDGIGCGQVHLKTAQHITGEPVGKWMLEHDWQMNMVIANMYLLKCARLFGWPAAFSCYNLGVPTARKMNHWRLLHTQYLHSIQYRMAELKLLPIEED